MSYSGTVKNGVVVLPAHVNLPDGFQVDVVPREERGEEDPLLRAVVKTMKKRTWWPRDYALNHGHYVVGEPKKP